MLVEDKIKRAMEEAMDCQSVTVDSDGRHYALKIISDEFEGMKTLQRQQKVYVVLSDFITDGSVHAVTIKALTVEEAKTQEGS
jgi:acid stress-induced BolA-like protein IbaG/YrbA